LQSLSFPATGEGQALIGNSGGERGAARNGGQKEGGQENCGKRLFCDAGNMRRREIDRGGGQCAAQLRIGGAFFACIGMRCLFVLMR